MPSSSTCSLRRTAPGANVFNSAITRRNSHVSCFWANIRPMHGDRQKHIESARTGLVPFLAKIETNDREVFISFVLPAYSCIDNVSSPSFVEDSFPDVLESRGPKNVGKFRCAGLQSSCLEAPPTQLPEVFLEFEVADRCSVRRSFRLGPEALSR